ncbi:Efm4 protein [Saccharomycopsis crataegensis]|uniref:Protein-lysine N-methyltransferase EFM4 n=1 Tax=Saccharomycopsis crataegensis TaxID=43959 RepID=A0AAV5QR35_9ASCO|nr:Efm4 protein [Saccharomycopsis crataegensis]
MSNEDFSLSKSKLGTKEYWNDFYKLEQTNFQSNSEDTGECWFDESDAENRMIDFLVSNFQELPTINEDSKIIDLGTGNGHLLFELYQHEDEVYVNNRLIGLDYSENSVNFAKDIAKSKNLDNILFYQVDFLTKYKEFWGNEIFQNVDVFLDKGTLDAIALNDAKYPFEDGKSYLGYELYPRIIEKSIKQEGIILITSCNFSEEELEKVILENSTRLKVWKKIKYPSFQFGGVKGSAICSIAFIKE